MGRQPIRRLQGVLHALPVALALLTLQGCGLGAAFSAPAGPTTGGAVTEAVVGAVDSLNPLFADNDNSRDVDSLIFRGLVGIDGEQRPVPDLAESWAVSPDQLAYTFVLRRDVRWADGRPFSVDDVLFTFGLLQDPAYRPAGAQAWPDVKVELAGERDVRFSLKAPDSGLLLNLRQAILPKHVFKDIALPAMAGDPASTTRALGTGPFAVESISRDRRLVTLKRNPHARPLPRLDHIVFRGYPTLGDAVEAVARGEADAVAALQPPQLAELAKRGDLSVRQIRTFSVVEVVFNRSGDGAPFFGADGVRRALAMGVDRQQVVNGILEGRATAAPGPIPPSAWAFSRGNAEKYGFDRSQAARMLDAEGWTMAPGREVRTREGRDFSVTLTTADAYPYAQVADVISKQLKLLGVDVRIDPVPASVLLGRLLQTQYQMALVSFDLGPDPDQYSLWHSNAPQGSLNFASPRLPRQALIDKDLEDGRVFGATRDRRRVYEDFQDLISDAAPAIFLFQPNYAYVLGRRVHGVRTNPVIQPGDRFQFVSEWWVQKTG